MKTHLDFVIDELSMCCLADFHWQVGMVESTLHAHHWTQNLMVSETAHVDLDTVTYCM